MIVKLFTSVNVGTEFYAINMPQPARKLFIFIFTVFCGFYGKRANLEI